MKKLELISNGLGRNEKIIYINFDSKSKLHFLREKNLKKYVEISSRKTKCINGIQGIVESPDPLTYVYHNSRGKNLSAILQETVRLNMTASAIDKANYHLIVEEYDGETLTRFEVAKINELVRNRHSVESNDEAVKILESVKGSDLRESYIILLAQPLMKNRSWNIGKESFERKTLEELENTFKIVKLEEVLNCSYDISVITKSPKNFVRNQDSIFKTKMVKATFEQRHQPVDSKKHVVSLSLPELNQLEVGTSRNDKSSYPSDDSTKADESLDLAMDLDQAF